MFHVKQIEYRVSTSCELLQFLFEQMPDSSRSKVKELLSHSICVYGRHVTQYNYPLQPGMVVSVEKVGYRERLKPRDLDIVYEDEHLFVVNKHEGLLSYSKNQTDRTVITVLNRYLQLTHQLHVGHHLLYNQHFQIYHQHVRQYK